jgi:3-oxoacyl-[acyl-carrier protein] reductase
MKLDGKVAIVVGSTSGIGKAIAERFAAEGATAIITGRRNEEGKKVVDGITKAGGKADFYKVDVRDIKSCYSLIDGVVAKYGKLDILDYNAGIGKLDKLEDTVLGTLTEEVWDAIFDTNLRSAFFMTQKALPELYKTKGSVVYTSSIAGVCPYIAQSTVAYGSTKAAILMMMKAIALNVADKGVRVNAVVPGLTETDIFSSIQPKVLEETKAAIPLKKMAQPKNIADSVLFLVSDEASNITGQYIAVCGGQSIL